jgi:hypothetical protein
LKNKQLAKLRILKRFGDKGAVPDAVIGLSRDVYKSSRGAIK